MRRLLTLLRGDAPRPVKPGDPALEYELAATILERQGDTTGRVLISPKLARMLAVLARAEARRLRGGAA